ncbi:MAG: 50S ribosomal protein L23 [Phycisphaeraceae bacterium]
MEASQIIKRPLVTEKGTWEADRHNRYAFEVDRRADKPSIRQAVENLYDVRVRKVRTQVRKGSFFRTRYGLSKTSTWKKALVELQEGDRIELF